MIEISGRSAIVEPFDIYFYGRGTRTGIVSIRPFNSSGEGVHYQVRTEDGIDPYLHIDRVPFNRCARVILSFSVPDFPKALAVGARMRVEISQRHTAQTLESVHISEDTSEAKFRLMVMAIQFSIVVFIIVSKLAYYGIYR